MSNNFNQDEEAQRPRLSVQAVNAEDSRRSDGPFFRYDFPVTDANSDISKQFRAGPGVCSEIFL